MRVSLGWVRRILGTSDLGISDAALADRIALHLTEVEEVLRSGPALDGVVVGRVLTCAQHPNADRLRVTTVDVGGPEPLPVVCGAPNVAAGQLVACATIGAVLTMSGKDGKPATITIKESKLRGEISRGMLCAEDELGLGAGHDGILVLTGDHRPGTPLRAALGLGDTVLDISNTAITHRADLWGHLGWAREVAAILDLSAPATPDISWRDDPQGWQARIEDPGCISYCGAVVEGVHNGDSPRWMRELLESAGVRPLGILVDVTNYVMLELGEPMHAFDVRAFPTRTVVPRAARPDEPMTTLDGRQHRLAAGDVVIANEAEPLAVAGIMGGAGSAVRADTSAIVLEAATFVPERIRRTRQRLGLATDSSARFEKMVQPELAPAAIHRAVALLRELCPGCRVKARFHAGPVAGETRTIAFDLNEVDARSGLRDGPAAARRNLERLGFTVDGADAAAQVRVPWWRRRDVAGPADLVEEAGRLAGWHRIVPETPRLAAEAVIPHPLRAAEHRARAVLSAQGWDEIATYAFTSEAWCQTLGTDPAQVIRLEHASQPEWACLRPSLVPGLAAAIAANRKSLPRVACYEVGKRYGRGFGQGAFPDEEQMVAGACAAQGDETPFFAARDAALALLAGLGHAATFRPSTQPHPVLVAGRLVELLVGATVVGLAGELNATVRERAGCPERVGLFCLHLERLVTSLGTPAPVRCAMPSRFPAVENDFTWECPESLPYADLESRMRSAAGPVLVGIALKGIYRGAPYPAGSKAVTITVTLQSADRTLAESDIAQVRERIIAGVTRATPAQLRG